MMQAISYSNNNDFLVIVMNGLTVNNEGLEPVLPICHDLRNKGKC